jgi:hypothetical protein
MKEVNQQWLTFLLPNNIIIVMLNPSSLINNKIDPTKTFSTLITGGFNKEAILFSQKMISENK